MKIVEKIYDITTGEETITERDETPDESILRIAREKEEAKLQAFLAQKAAEKAALLNRLGLTEDELKTILG